MGLSYEEARELEAQAREAVAKCTARRNEAQAKYDTARAALEVSRKKRAAAKQAMEDLHQKLRSTREAIMPNEAASKRAQHELELSQQELASARDKRVEAENRIFALEQERDEATMLLDGAQDALDRTGAMEITSRATLDERVQRATDAQRALDAALRAIDEAKEDVLRVSQELEGARNAAMKLPNDDCRRRCAQGQGRLRKCSRQSPLCHRGSGQGGGPHEGRPTSRTGPRGKRAQQGTGTGCCRLCGCW